MKKRTLTEELEFFMRSAKWPKLRQAAYAYHGKACIHCGADQTPLDVYFLRYGQPIETTKPEDCIPLCKNCKGAHLEDIRRGREIEPDLIETVEETKPQDRIITHWRNKSGVRFQ